MPYTMIVGGECIPIAATSRIVRDIQRNCITVVDYRGNIEHQWSAEYLNCAGGELRFDYDDYDDDWFDYGTRLNLNTMYPRAELREYSQIDVTTARCSAGIPGCDCLVMPTESSSRIRGRSLELMAARWDGASALVPIPGWPGHHFPMPGAILARDIVLAGGTLSIVFGSYTPPPGSWEYRPATREVVWHGVPAQRSPAHRAAFWVRREAELVDAWLRWQEKLRAQRRESERRAAAKRRATALLLSLLDETQRAEYAADRSFTLTGSLGGRYRIEHGYSGNVVLLDPKRGHSVASFCVHPTMHANGKLLPDEDAMVAQLLWLTTDERGFHDTPRKGVYRFVDRSEADAAMAHIYPPQPPTTTVVRGEWTELVATAQLTGGTIQANNLVAGNLVASNLVTGNIVTQQHIAGIPAAFARVAAAAARFASNLAQPSTEFAEFAEPVVPDVSGNRIVAARAARQRGLAHQQRTQQRRRAQAAR